jgi:hypothetical protein
MNARIIKSSKGLPATRGRLDLRPARPTQPQPTVRQISLSAPPQPASSEDKSARFMREIWHRAQAPFRSSVPGPDYQSEPVYPPILSRL